jgi:hypothetical protein
MDLASAQRMIGPKEHQRIAAELVRYFQNG